MYEIERTIATMDERNDSQIDAVFGRQVGLDMDRIPKKMQEKVDATRAYAMEHFKVTSVYESVPIGEVGEDKVNAGSGQVFTSKMMGQLLQEADCIVGIASALEGLDEAMDVFPKITDQMYIDGWATAILTSANLDLRMKLKKQIEEAGLFATPTWSPGQHGFEIENQIPFFELFHPEEIGIRLKETLMMTPQKSETLLFGISRKDQSDAPPPCAFCPHRKTCPSAFGEQNYESEMD